MSALREDFDRASGVKTPWNPSRKAIARVSNPLPAPEECPYCESAVELVGNEKIYGHQYGKWPWAYLCSNKGCCAYVGLHPYTAIPLGTLADAELRKWRKAAKDAFNPKWNSDVANMSRSEAYAWLARELRIDAGECHIGWFDVPTCQLVIEVCRGQRPVDDFEAATLIAKVRKMDDELSLMLTSKQQRWLDDILEADENGTFKPSANALKFLKTCASGFYSSEEFQ